LQTTVLRTRQVLEALSGIQATAEQGLGMSRDVIGAARAIGEESGSLEAAVGAFLVSLRKGPLDRRDGERQALSASAELVTERGVIPVKLFDVSRSGAKFSPAAGLVVGGSVLLRLAGGQEIAGKVKWIADGHAGVALPPGVLNSAVLERLRARPAA
jgi:hypothetical protein